MILTEPKAHAEGSERFDRHASFSPGPEVSALRILRLSTVLSCRCDTEPPPPRRSYTRDCLKASVSWRARSVNELGGEGRATRTPRRAATVVGNDNDDRLRDYTGPTTRVPPLLLQMKIGEKASKHVRIESARAQLGSVASTRCTGIRRLQVRPE